mmetsp:Transcript_142120/g.441944  ORF Transcript_142120/g.441944 Transcript_142120/m.441944 type:complete len:337 (-) Transcript_142120:626-1636(-)
MPSFCMDAKCCRIVDSYFCCASWIMFSSMATSRRCSSCLSCSWLISSGTAGGIAESVSPQPAPAAFDGVALTTLAASTSSPEASSSLAAPAALAAPGSRAFIVILWVRRFALAWAKRSSNSSQAALKPARCVSNFPPDFDPPATARNKLSTGLPFESMECTPAVASPDQSASSLRAWQTPASGKPSRLANFLTFRRLEVFPTSRGKSWPAFACSSRTAQGSAMAGRAFFSSSPSGKSFFIGVVLTSCFDGVCVCFTTWPSSSSAPGDLASSSAGLALSSGSSLSSSCKRSSRSCTSRGGAGTSGPSMKDPCMVSSVVSRSSSSLASDSCRRYTPVR